MAEPTTEELVSFGEQLRRLATRRPDESAIVFVGADGARDELTWRELDEQSNAVARRLAAAGLGVDDVLPIAMLASRWHAVAVYGAWKLGVNVMPLSDKLPAHELAEMLACAGDPTVIVARPSDALDALRARFTTVLGPDDLDAAISALDRAGLPDVVAPRAILFASGGSTGRPKIVNSYGAGAKTPGKTLPVGPQLGHRAGQRTLITSPMYHAMGFSSAYLSLFEDRHPITMERFEAGLALQLIEEYRVNYVLAVPTMMQRMIRHPDIDRRDLSSVETLLHAASPCAPWLKRAWIDRLGGPQVREFYSASEQLGFTILDGDEWLAHPGSVGRPVNSELRIQDEHGVELPAGEIGEIFMKIAGTDGPIFEYLGEQRPRVTDDGLSSVGDLGWVDADGFLYIADRRTDLIITGGANVYPAEVEAAISERTDVRDCVVIPLPSEEWGAQVHALIEPVDAAHPPTIEDLVAHCRTRLAPYKVPKSWEMIDEMPRNTAGKVRRSALAAERRGDDTVQTT
jgi:bile acid-coenzyme A ligase